MGSSPIRVANRYASVAQLVEQGTENPRVVGSIPTGGTISADLAHLVERHLAKVEVAGSSPVIRSKKVQVARLGLFYPLRKQWHIIGSLGAAYHQQRCNVVVYHQPQAAFSFRNDDIQGLRLDFTDLSFFLWSGTHGACDKAKKRFAIICSKGNQ